jgi:hypothetical protein
LIDALLVADHRLLTAGPVTKSSTSSPLCIAHSKTTCRHDRGQTHVQFAGVKEKKMISTNSKLALALGVIGAIALSIPSAEARTKRSTPKAQSSVITDPFAYQAPTWRDPVYSREPSFRGSYNLYGGNGYSGGGINYNDGQNGANWNRNQ